MFTKNCTKLRAAVHELSCAQREKTPTKTILFVVAANSNKPNICKPAPYTARPEDQGRPRFPAVVVFRIWKRGHDERVEREPITGSEGGTPSGVQEQSPSQGFGGEAKLKYFELLDIQAKRQICPLPQKTPQIRANPTTHPTGAGRSRDHTGGLVRYSCKQPKLVLLQFLRTLR